MKTNPLIRTIAIIITIGFIITNSGLATVYALRPETADGKAVGDMGKEFSVAGAAGTAAKAGAIGRVKAIVVDDDLMHSSKVAHDILERALGFDSNQIYTTTGSGLYQLLKNLRETGDFIIFVIDYISSDQGTAYIIDSEGKRKEFSRGPGSDEEQLLKAMQDSGISTVESSESRYVIDDMTGELRYRNGGPVVHYDFVTGKVIEAPAAGTPTEAGAIGILAKAHLYLMTGVRGLGETDLFKTASKDEITGFVKSIRDLRRTLSAKNINPGNILKYGVPTVAQALKTPDQFQQATALATRLAEKGIDPYDTLQYGVPAARKSSTTLEELQANLNALEGLVMYLIGEDIDRLSLNHAIGGGVPAIAQASKTPEEFKANLVALEGLAIRLKEKEITPANVLSDGFSAVLRISSTPEEFNIYLHRLENLAIQMQKENSRWWYSFGGVAEKALSVDKVKLIYHSEIGHGGNYVEGHMIEGYEVSQWVEPYYEPYVVDQPAWIEIYYGIDRIETIEQYGEVIRQAVSNINTERFVEREAYSNRIQSIIRNPQLTKNSEIQQAFVEVMPSLINYIQNNAHGRIQAQDIIAVIAMNNDFAGVVEMQRAMAQLIPHLISNITKFSGYDVMPDYYARRRSILYEHNARIRQTIMFPLISIIRNLQFTKNPEIQQAFVEAMPLLIVSYSKGRSGRIYKGPYMEMVNASYVLAAIANNPDLYGIPEIQQAMPKDIPISIIESVAEIFAPAAGTPIEAGATGLAELQKQLTANISIMQPIIPEKSGIVFTPGVASLGLNILVGHMNVPARVLTKDEIAQLNTPQAVDERLQQIATELKVDTVRLCKLTSEEISALTAEIIAIDPTQITAQITEILKRFGITFDNTDSVKVEAARNAYQAAAAIAKSV